jgi:small nuclear ribonucleoprotein (snRNP)-like protein
LANRVGQEIVSSTADRKFMEELSNLLQKNVSILTSAGKTFVGTLTGVDTDRMSVCLTNAKSDGVAAHKLFLNGDVIVQISSFERPFDLQSLGERLERVFPRMVRVMDDAGVIVVMDRIRVTEKGIVEGAGPAAERVQKVFEEFLREKGRP